MPSVGVGEDAALASAVGLLALSVPVWPVWEPTVLSGIGPLGVSPRLKAETRGAAGVDVGPGVAVCAGGVDAEVCVVAGEPDDEPGSVLALLGDPVPVDPGPAVPDPSGAAAAIPWPLATAAPSASATANRANQGTCVCCAPITGHVPAAEAACRLVMCLARC